MLNSETNIHSLSYFIVLLMLAISIPLSKFTMSISQFMLLGLWLWSGFSFRVSYSFFKVKNPIKSIGYFLHYVILLAYNNFVDKFILFFKNKPALIFTLIYFIHILGVIYSSDMDYAIKDLRIKVPLLLLPLIISTMPKINSKQFRVLLLFYSLSVLISTIIGFYFFLTYQYIDIRDISPFISPIRMGLNVSFSFFIMIYFIFHDKSFNIWQVLGFVIVAVWLLTFLVLLEAATSIVIVLLISVGYLFARLISAMILWQKIIFVVLAIIIPTLFVVNVVNIINEATNPPNVNFSSLDKLTKQGNTYEHDTTYLKIEDGKYVGLYLCYNELISEWNKRSTIDYYGKSHGGHMINATLIRYLTSLNLRKDAEGVAALSDYDINMIEQGVANYHYVNSPGLRTRLLKIIMGYQVYMQTGNPSGSSVMQRYEYMRASINIIKNHFLIGVGTGDLENSYYGEFNKMKSVLESQYRYHAHNQFLGIFVAFGILGFIIFVIGLVYPMVALQGYKDYYFIVFFMIMFVSFFSDDTLETQAGATLFAFFYSLLLFGRKKGDDMPATLRVVK